MTHEVSIKIRSDIGDHPRFQDTKEWLALSASPTDWLQLVNQPQTEAEVAALRGCVNRGRPFGDPTDRCAKSLTFGADGHRKSWRPVQEE